MFNWWQSTEVITKLGTIVAILIIGLSGFGLVLKVQGDRLKDKRDKEQQRLNETTTSELRVELNTTKTALETSDKTIKRLNVDAKEAQEQVALA